MGSFDDVIQQHLDLKRRNSHLEASLPLANYETQGGFVTDRTQGVFDAESGVEGAAFNTAEWKSAHWFGRESGRAEVEARDVPGVTGRWVERS